MSRTQTCGTELTFPQWNQPSIDFYEKKIGAMPLSEFIGTRLDNRGIEELKKLAPQTPQ